MDKKTKVNDYIIATETIRGKCKKDRRYKVLNVHKKDELMLELDALNMYYMEDMYLIKHNGRYTYSECCYFIIDIKYMRKRKMRKMKIIS